jgi:hypothetical protein
MEGSVLPPFIIEQIRQREERERSRREDERRPRVELPVAPAGPIKRRVDEEEPDPDRGVIIVDLGG